MARVRKAEAGASAANGKKAFFSADLPPGELDRILARIDENLAFRESQKAQSTAARWGPSQAAVALSREVAHRLEALQASYGTAPLFVVSGRGPRNLVKRVLNLPLRVFGRRQRAFNRESLALLSDVTAALQVLGALGEETRTMADSMAEGIKKAAKSEKEMRGWLETLAEKDEQIESWLRSVAEREEGTEKWVAAIQEEVREIAFEIREGKAAKTRKPLGRKIVSPDAFAAKLASMGDDAKVNLGSGRLPAAGYMNIDFRQVPGVDVVADVRDMPFEDGSLSEISSAHLVEHFREYEFKTRILPYWRGLLKEGGRLRIVCPNWEATLEQFQAGKMPLSRFKEITFGAQDYEGDDHFTMYTPATLTALLHEGGFGDVELVDASRDNSGCPEMELVAYKKT